MILPKMKQILYFQIQYANVGQDVSKDYSQCSSVPFQEFLLRTPDKQISTAQCD